jgi:hypothetical protein
MSLDALKPAISVEMPIDTRNTQGERINRIKHKAMASTPGPISNEQTVPESTYVEYKLGKMPYVVQPSSGGPTIVDAGCCGPACLPCGITPGATWNYFPLALRTTLPFIYGGTIVAPQPPPSNYPLQTCMIGNSTGFGMLVFLPACSSASYSLTLTKYDGSTIPLIQEYIGSGIPISGTRILSDFIAAYPTSNISCTDFTNPGNIVAVNIITDTCTLTVNAEYVELNA